MAHKNIWIVRSCCRRHSLLSAGIILFDSGPVFSCTVAVTHTGPLSKFSPILIVQPDMCELDCLCHGLSFVFLASGTHGLSSHGVANPTCSAASALLVAAQALTSCVWCCTIP